MPLFLILEMSGYGYVRLLKPFLEPDVRFSEIKVTDPGASVNTYEKDQK